MAEKKSWRDILAVHPAAELFPLMSEPELRELGEDIKKNKLQIPIVVWRRGDQYKKPKQYSLLDGRNRLDAMELVGIPFQLHWRERYHFWDLDSDCISDNAVTVEVQNADPYEFVLSANAHRRHLTAEQKRELIAELLKAKPQASNNAVAKQVKADDKTVAKVRRETEGRSEIPNVETRTDTRGRKQPAKRKKADDNPKVTTPVPETSAEPSGSWMVRAIDDEGGCWSSGVRLRTKQEGAAYMGMWAYGALRDEPHTIMEIRVIKSNDEPNIWIAKNKKGHHRTLCFEHGQCGLLKWKRDAQSCPSLITPSSAPSETPPDDDFPELPAHLRRVH